jgi:hypothetical protein
MAAPGRRFFHPAHFPMPARTDPAPQKLRAVGHIYCAHQAHRIETCLARRFPDPPDKFGALFAGHFFCRFGAGRRRHGIRQKSRLA